MNSACTEKSLRLDLDDVDDDCLLFDGCFDVDDDDDGSPDIVVVVL